MSRYLSSMLMLLGVVFWLFFSYAPGAADALPKLTVSASFSNSWLQVFAIFVLLLFIVAQLVILRATLRLRTAAVKSAEHNIQLNLALELLWAGLPLVMTVGLALLCYRTWISLG